MTDIDTFRQETAAWLEENCPPSMRTPMTSDDDTFWGGRNTTFQSDDQRLWFERMVEKKWTVPHWPKEYGGGGLNQVENKVLREEMSAIGARLPLVSFGISMLGPALLKFGNEEQKKTHLPKITRGEIRWCQGYSEPNAGSDLASLQTKAEDKGDHYLVNGQKIWTSYANKADWIFCLVRTDFDAPKHEGISFLLFDMASDGVSTKPIKLISGSSPFCETFFDNVKVPKEDQVGELNKGWTIAKYLLTHEREMIGDMGKRGSSVTLGQRAVRKVGLENDKLADIELRSDIASFEIDSAAFALTIDRVKDEAQAGQGLGAASSILKYYGTELNKTRNELMMDIGGSEALGWEGDAVQEGAVPRGWLRSRANSIEGGTSEVQLNIISKRILNLPS
jgi:alkylation response protein AidB-like acyl-CoA dehydrogenase